MSGDRRRNHKDLIVLLLANLDEVESLLDAVIAGLRRRDQQSLSPPPIP